MDALHLNEYPEDAENSEQGVRVRIPLAGLAITLSLLVGAAAGIIAYRYAAAGGRPPVVKPAPVAAAAPTAEKPAVSDKPEEKSAATEKAATPEKPVVSEQPATSEKPSVGSQPAVRRIETKLVHGHLQLTITLDQVVLYDAHRLDHPDRIYVDLHGAHLAPELSSHTAVKKQGGVSNIRLGQIPPDTVRVVLDLDKRFDYSIIQQTNPAALVLKLTPHAAAHHTRRPAASAPASDRLNRTS